MAVQDLPISFPFLSSQELRYFKFPGRARVYKTRLAEPTGCLLCSSFLMCPPYPIYFNQEVLCSRGFSHLEIQLEVPEQGETAGAERLAEGQGKMGINGRDLFIQTVMKSGVEALQVLCEDGEISPCWGLWLGSGQVCVAGSR